MGGLTKSVLLILLCAVVSGSLKAETLKVAFAHWPPWKIYESGSVDGIDARIIRALGKKTGFDIEFVYCPWARCISFIKDGHADLISSFGWTKERAEFTHFLSPSYFNDTIAFWTRRDSGPEIKSFDDLSELKIGVAAGSVYFPDFERGAAFQRVVLDFEEQMFKMLESKRIDAFIGYETSIKYQLLRKQYDGQFKMADYKALGRRYYLGMSKKSDHSHARASLEKELAAMVEKGEISRIVEQFLKGTSN